MLDPDYLGVGLEGPLSDYFEDLKRFESLQLNLVRQTSFKHLIIQDSDLDCFENVLLQGRLQLGYLRKLISLRKAYKAQMSGKDVTFLALGFDCLPRTMLTKYGIMPPRSEGTITGPFDLAVHPLASVISLVNTGFSQYADPDAYVLNDNHLPYHRHLGITFNHEKSLDLFQGSFRGLREVYHRRSANFLSLCKCTSTVFVAHVRHVDMHLLPSLRDALDRISSKKNKLIVITESDTISCSIDTIGVIKMLSPQVGGYKWYLPEFFATPEALAAESGVINQLVEYLDEWF